MNVAETVKFRGIGHNDIEIRLLSNEMRTGIMKSRMRFGHTLTTNSFTTMIVDTGPDFHERRGQDYREIHREKMRKTEIESYPELETGKPPCVYPAV